MAKVIVFHFTEQGRLPKLTEEELKNLREKFDEELKNYPGVTLSTYVDENGMGICDWEAPDAETVKKIVEKVLGSPPADPTIVVKKVL
jgi:hypothetical protein